MSNIPKNLKYSKSHEWIRSEDGKVITVGISDHAQALLGDLVYIELPEIGDEYTSGEECCVVESVKAASDVYCPVAGKVIEINKNLVDAPEDVNQNPYDSGWLFKLEVANQDEIKQLIDYSAYKQVISEEA